MKATATLPASKAGDDRDDGRPVRRIVPAAGAAPLATTGASSPFALGRAAAQQNAKRLRNTLPDLAIDAIQVQRDVPIPQPRMRKGATKYDPLLDKLQADGDCVQGLPVAYKAALLKAIEFYLRHRPQLAAKSAFLVRHIPDTEHIGIWRQAKPAQAAKPARGAKP